MRLRRFFKATVFGLGFIVASSSLGFAETPHCDLGSNIQPCDGAPGRWSFNFDGTPGGFVAHTANVESSSILGYWRKNLSYIGPCVQVCESAKIQGDEVVLNGHAVIAGNALITGAAKVYDYAHVYGNAEVFGEAEIHGASHVFGQVTLFGTVQVFGMAVLQGSHTMNRGMYFIDDSEISLTYSDSETTEAIHNDEWNGIREQEQEHEEPVTQANSERIANTLAELNADRELAEVLGPKKQAIEIKIALLKEDLNSERNKLERLETQLKSCPVCYDPFYKAKYLTLFPCNHLLCRSCFSKVEPFGREGRRCPFCRKGNVESQCVRIEYPAQSTLQSNVHE